MTPLWRRKKDKSSKTAKETRKPKHRTLTKKEKQQRQALELSLSSILETRFSDTGELLAPSQSKSLENSSQGGKEALRGSRRRLNTG